MGVDISFSVGYGVGGTFNEPSDLPGKLRKLEWDDLYEGNLGVDLPAGISFQTGGNQMCGDYTWFLYITESYMCADKFNSPEITRLEDVSVETATSLSKAMDLLEVFGSPGWFFFCDVS